jgi:predicted DNA-binding protein (MmcQ/YjbR family)
MKTPPLKHGDAKKLRSAALAYPGTFEDFPWDHHAFKAPNKKVFLFLTGMEDGGFNCSLKLPYRNTDALKLKEAEPTGYGMSRTGWVTFTFSGKAKPPVALLIDYLDESWRAVAPKKLTMAQAAPAAPAKQKTAAKKSAAKKKRA